VTEISDIVQIIQAVSLIIGIVAFFREYHKSLRDRGYNTYLQTVFSFIELEKMCIQHPELQAVWEYDDTYKGLTKDKRKRKIWFGMLLDIFEIVYLAHHRKWMSKEEWEGWEEFITTIAQNDDFRIAWEASKKMFATEFSNYVEKFIIKTKTYCQG